MLKDDNFIIAQVGSLVKKEIDMSVIRIVKDKNFVTMGKYHLKEKDMSLKAIGLLSIMLSLPDDWDYSISGLTAIRKESYDSIRATLNELEQFGYLNRTQITDKGKFVDVEYTIFEKPILEKPLTEKPITENQGQLNTNIINNLNNKKENIKERFVKPTLEEVEEYCRERNNNVDAESFIDFYESKGWMVGKSKMKDWKACVRTWEKNHKNNSYKNNTKQELELPEWFDKETDVEKISKEEEEELKKILEGFD